jgi:hypothetical protein
MNIPVPLGTRMAYFAASRYGDELALWYGDHARAWWERELARGRHLPSYSGGPWADLFRPDRPAVENAPPFPTAFMLESIQYATLRSAPRFDCRWMAGLKGLRAPYTHHGKRDAGAVCVHLRGERLLIDAGYNMPYPTDHCLPTLDGQGADVEAEFPGRIEVCEDRGRYRVVSCDSTQAYGGKAAVMQVDLLGADAGNLTRHPQRELTKWGYCFAECEMQPVTVDYTADPQRPLISVCRDVTDGPRPAPAFRPVEGGCVVELDDGRRVRFCLQDGRWTVAEAH